jgi:hypothetical protein
MALVCARVPVFKLSFLSIFSSDGRKGQPSEWIRMKRLWWPVWCRFRPVQNENGSDESPSLDLETRGRTTPELSHLHPHPHTGLGKR